MRLLTDAMLGTLTTYLRFAGHDTAYALEEGVEADDAVLGLAERENRRLVTRDRDLAARAPDPYLLTERDVADQLAELASQDLDLPVPAEPVRCGSCNGQLERVPAGEPTPAYAPEPAAGTDGEFRSEPSSRHSERGGPHS
ncbi:MAG: DUF5615 family PIN-like protein, partial [Haloarculaceae archaeon]